MLFAEKRGLLGTGYSDFGEPTNVQVGLRDMLKLGLFLCFIFCTLTWFYHVFGLFSNGNAVAATAAISPVPSPIPDPSAGQSGSSGTEEVKAAQPPLVGVGGVDGLGKSFAGVGVGAGGGDLGRVGDNTAATPSIPTSTKSHSLLATQVPHGRKTFGGDSSTSSAFASASVSASAGSAAAPPVSTGAGSAGTEDAAATDKMTITRLDHHHDNQHNNGDDNNNNNDNYTTSTEGHEQAAGDALVPPRLDTTETTDDAIGSLNFDDVTTPNKYNHNQQAPAPALLTEKESVAMHHDDRPPGVRPVALRFATMTVSRHRDIFVPPASVDAATAGGIGSSDDAVVQRRPSDVTDAQTIAQQQEQLPSNVFKER